MVLDKYCNISLIPLTGLSAFHQFNYLAADFMSYLLILCPNSRPHYLAPTGGATAPLSIQSLKWVVKSS